MSRFTLKKDQAVEVWEDMIGLRREFRTDAEFFRVPDFWTEMCNDVPDYQTKVVAGGDPNRAGMIAFGDRATLITSRIIWERADRGCWLSNFTLAHEITHLARDHHANGAIVKNFKLFDVAHGRSNVPPTMEEYETNIGAAVLQCGGALMDERLSALELARLANSDPVTVEKAQAIFQFSGFHEALIARKERFPRVVL